MYAMIYLLLVFPEKLNLLNGLKLVGLYVDARTFQKPKTWKLCWKNKNLYLKSADVISNLT